MIAAVARNVSIIYREQLTRVNVTDAFTKTCNEVVKKMMTRNADYKGQYEGLCSFKETKGQEKQKYEHKTYHKQHNPQQHQFKRSEIERYS